jgi:hypothetical protein
MQTLAVICVICTNVSLLVGHSGACKLQHRCNATGKQRVVQTRCIQVAAHHCVPTVMQTGQTKCIITLSLVTGLKLDAANIYIKNMLRVPIMQVLTSGCLSEHCIADPLLVLHSYKHNNSIVVRKSVLKPLSSLSSDHHM